MVLKVRLQPSQFRLWVFLGGNKQDMVPQVHELGLCEAGQVTQGQKQDATCQLGGAHPLLIAENSLESLGVTMPLSQAQPFLRLLGDHRDCSKAD